VWKWFDEVIEENGAGKGCKNKYTGDSKKGTSNLHKHLKSYSKNGRRDAKTNMLVQWRRE
jgi:hypothetical protein